MNLKERGITVGDLIIIITIVLISTTLFKTSNKEKKSTLNPINHEKVTSQKILISKKSLKHIDFIKLIPILI